MDTNELKRELDEIHWEEQMEFELTEADPQSGESLHFEIQKKIKELAYILSSIDLDNLQQDDDYIIWALRLSPHVPDDDSRSRAKNFLKHRDSQVRFYASEIITSSR